MYVKKVAAVCAMMMAVILCAPAALAAESGSAWDQVKAAGSDIWNTVKENAPSVWDSTKDKASELYDKAKEKAPEVKEKVKTSVNDAQEKISDYRAEQEDEFWDWFDTQTNGAGSTKTTSSQSSEERPGSENDPEPKANPDKATLDVYAEDKVYYYGPDATAHEASDADTPPAIDDENTPLVSKPEGDPDTAVLPAERNSFDSTVVLIICATVAGIAAIGFYSWIKVRRMEHERQTAELKSRQDSES